MFPPQIIIVDCHRHIARRCVSNLTRPDLFDKEKAPRATAPSLAGVSVAVHFQLRRHHDVGIAALKQRGSNFSSEQNCKTGIRTRLAFAPVRSPNS
jgi:hypothetical protein